MKLGFVTQPWALALPPSESIAIGTRAIAERLADEHEPLIWSPPPPGGSERGSSVNGVEYRFVSGRGDYRLARVTERLPLFSERRPLFSSPLYHPSYHLQVALAARREQPDAIRISNFSNLVPLFRRACPSALVVLSMHCEWLTQLDRRLVDRRLSKADVIVGVSDFVTERIREAFPRHASRCVTVHNGADLGRFAPEERRGRSGRVRLLAVGRISPEKGTHVLLKAFAHLAERRGDVELHVVGKEGLPPREMLLNLDETPRVRALAPYFREGYLQRLRENLPERARDLVQFPGWAQHDDLSGKYARADVFVFPSVWDEPFGIPEIVADGETGLLVEPGDAESLAAALEQLVDDAELRARLGEAGRQQAAERFSWDRAAAAYREIFTARR